MVYLSNPRPIFMKINAVFRQWPVTYSANGIPKHLSGSIMFIYTCTDRHRRKNAKKGLWRPENEIKKQYAFIHTQAQEETL